MLDASERQNFVFHVINLHNLHTLYMCVETSLQSKLAELR